MIETDSHGQPLEVDDLDADWLLDFAHEAEAEVRRAERRRLRVVLRWCDLMGAQRHLKVIGIFARIRHRDGKPKYLEDAPRFFAYLRTVIARRPDELGELGQLLDLWECP